MPNYQAHAAAWSERIRESALATSVVTNLEGRAEDIWRRTFDLLRKESPEYRNAVDDGFTAESKSHCGELLGAIVAIGRGHLKGPEPFAFVRRHAEWRARHQVPLVASLHAYRLAHKTYWKITREQLAQHRKGKRALDALAVLSDFWIELFEAVGAELEDAHSEEEARIVAQHTRLHASVIEELLNGTDPAEKEARDLLTLCGLRPAKKMSVALIRPLATAQADAEIAKRSFIRLLQQVLPSALLGRLVGTRNGDVVVIANSAADTGARLAKSLGHGRRPELSAARTGISLDKTDIARLPEALAEARLALDLTADRPLVRFADIDLNEALVQRADRTLLGLIPDSIRASLASGRELELFATIRAFADCSMNVKETARRLRIHANTVYFRLNKIEQRTGVDPRTFTGMSQLVTALRLLDRLGGGSA